MTKLERGKPRQVLAGHRFAFARAIANSIGEGVLATDLDHRVIYANPAAERMLGWSRAELMGKLLHETIHYLHADGTPYPAADCPLADSIAAGKTLHIEDDSFVRKDGTLFPVSYTAAPIVIDGKLAGGDVVFTDVTQRKRMEDALWESEERYRILAEAAADGVILIDQNDRIIYVNPAGERIFGYRLEELAGRDLTMLIPPDLRQAHLRGLHRYLETGCRHLTWKGSELPGLRKDGTRIPLEISFGEFVRDGEHRFIGWARDITERKRAEESRVRLLAEEQQAHAAAEAARENLQRFLGMVAHDLRSPLTAVRGYTQLALHDTGNEPAKVHRALVTIDDAARRMDRLVGDLLDAARIGAGRFEIQPSRVNLVAILRKVVEQQQATAPRHQLVLEAPTYLEGVWDPARIAQIFTNLVSNAIKYSPHGSVVRVTATGEDREAVVCVIDQGVGISPDQIQRLFQPFNRAGQEQAATGTGLGLYIAKGIVEAHHGRIWLESTVGQGSRFCVALPDDG